MPGATPILDANARTAISVFSLGSSRASLGDMSTAREKRSASASFGSSESSRPSSIHTSVLPCQSRARLRGKT